LDPSKLTRALLGPILVLVVLLGVGYGAVVWEHSHPVHLTVQAVSMKFVSNQGASRISNWNMSIENNGTITAILGQICQRDPKTNGCTAVGPQFWGSPSTSDLYLVPGQRTVFKLVAVNSTYSTWELHLELFPWPSDRPPSDQDVINTVNNHPSQAEWLFYDSKGDRFIQ